MPLKMLRLMVYILAGKKPLPPLYTYHKSQPGLITRIDGTHRITLARYMGLETIPYLIESTTANFHHIYFPKQ